MFMRFLASFTHNQQRVILQHQRIHLVRFLIFKLKTPTHPIRKRIHTTTQTPLIVAMITDIFRTILIPIHQHRITKRQKFTQLQRNFHWHIFLTRKPILLTIHLIIARNINRFSKYHTLLSLQRFHRPQCFKLVFTQTNRRLS